MNNKVLKFNLDSKDIKIKKLLNGDFLRLEAFTVSSAKPNRNGSHFTRKSMEEAIPTFYDKPVLAYFNTKLGTEGDFMGHECPNDIQYDPKLDELYYDYTAPGSEIPIGTIRQSDTVEIVEKDGLDWIKVTCVLWTKYNYRAVRSLLRSRKGKTKLSVEVEVLESHMEEGIEVIDKFVLDGFTLLGRDANNHEIEEGIAGAHAVAIDFLDEKFSKGRACLAFAYSALDEYDSRNNVESSAGDVESQQNSNTVFDTHAKAKKEEEETSIDNEEKPQISMAEDAIISKEGGISNMSLSVNAKMDLLASALDKSLDSRGYLMDCDETYVYFVNFDRTMYRAPYTISEGEEGGLVQIDLAAQERVVSSWQKFNEQETVSETTEKTEEFCGDKITSQEEQDITDTVEEYAEGATEPDAEVETTGEDSEETETTETEEVETTEVETAETEEVVEETAEEFAEKETEGKCENKCNEEKVEEAKTGDDDEEDDDDDEDEDYDCDGKKGFVEEGKSIDLNAEPEPIDVEGQTMGEIIESSTQNIKAAPVQTEAEELGDANAATEEALDNTVAEISEGAITTEPVTAEEIGEEPAVEVLQPEDDLKERDNYSEGSEETVAEGVTTEAETAVFVEVDGEEVDVKALLEKYSELEAKLNTINESLKAQEAEKIVGAVTAFINNDEVVDDEAKQNYIAQVTEKCNAYEFTTEEEATKFAKSLMAMYYYEHATVDNHGETKEFALSINKPVQKDNILSGQEKLKDSIQKLDSVETEI